MGQHCHPFIHLLGKEKTEPGSAASGQHKYNKCSHCLKSWWLFRKKQVVISQIPCFPPCAWGALGRKIMSILWIQSLQTSFFSPCMSSIHWLFLACTKTQSPFLAQGGSDPRPHENSPATQEQTMIRQHINPEPGPMDSWQLFQMRAYVIRPLIL